MEEAHVLCAILCVTVIRAARLRHDLCDDYTLFVCACVHVLVVQQGVGVVAAMLGAFQSVVVPPLMRWGGWNLDTMGAVTEHAQRSAASAGGTGGQSESRQHQRQQQQQQQQHQESTLILYHPNDGVIPTSASLGLKWLQTETGKV